MIQQIHLIGKYHSKRVVQVRMLDSFEVEDNLTSAAKMLGKGVEYFEVKKAEWRNGVKKFIVAYSAPMDKAEGDIKFTKADQGTMDGEYTKLFTSKDTQVLEGVYRDFHEVSQEDIDAIMGKALPVSEG